MSGTSTGENKPTQNIPTENASAAHARPDNSPAESTRVGSGRCECGGVSYVVSGELRNVWNCHCEPCRRITGHHMAASGAAAADVAFTSDETLAWYERVEGVEYGFCARCGSSLFWRAADKPGHLSITAGSLDHPTGLVTDGVLFASEIGDYHTLEPDIPAWAHDRDSDAHTI